MTLDELMEHAGKWTPEEAGQLAQLVGSFDPSYDPSESDFWQDSVLQQYADYIRNYVYTYKPEARAVDPSIDPSQEQLGPMAQDIEKVNPACIDETSEGVKEVNTGRLALMNAGALGDVARKLQELEDRLSKLEGVS